MQSHLSVPRMFLYSGRTESPLHSFQSVQRWEHDKVHNSDVLNLQSCAGLARLHITSCLLSDAGACDALSEPGRQWFRPSGLA